MCWFVSRSTRSESLHDHLSISRNRFALRLPRRNTLRSSTEVSYSDTKASKTRGLRRSQLNSRAGKTSKCPR